MSVKISKSSRVRAEDFYTDWFLQRSKELPIPLKIDIPFYRKLWELSIIAQVYVDRIGIGGKSIGFGVGRETLPSWLANRGSNVIATDLPKELEQGNWSETNQHSESVEDIFYDHICSREKFNSHVRFVTVDMNHIPSALFNGSFDFLWSCGSCEHIGSIDNTLSFICESIKCLKQGGIAVHTTECNTESNIDTLEAHDIVLLREKDLIQLYTMLRSQGDLLLPLDLSPGEQDEDKYIDDYPYFGGPSHLSIRVNGQYVTTSIALVIIKGRDR